MIRKFELTDKEYAAALEFEKEHRHKEINKGAIGGGLAITFEPNGLGNIVSITCLWCKETKNITDYDSW